MRVVGVDGVFVGRVLPVELFACDAAVLPRAVLHDGAGDGHLCAGTFRPGQEEAHVVVGVEGGGTDGGLGVCRGGGCRHQLQVDGLVDVHTAQVLVVVATCCGQQCDTCCVEQPFHFSFHCL